MLIRFYLLGTSPKKTNKEQVIKNRAVKHYIKIIKEYD